MSGMINNYRGCMGFMCCLKTFTNDLAVYFDSAIVIAVADLLKQMRHFGKRTPSLVGGDGVLPVCEYWVGHPVEIARPNTTGYKTEAALTGIVVSA